ncbi:MAG: hypothetical protein U1E89_02505 [Burkholderiaceae bacterium]
MQIHGACRCGAIAGLVAALAGCYEARRADHATLEISAAGEYRLQGRSVAAPALQAAVQAVPHGGANLVVEIKASPRAEVSSVQAAVQAVKAAHAQVAFGASAP